MRTMLNPARLGGWTLALALALLLAGAGCSDDSGGGTAAADTGGAGLDTGTAPDGAEQDTAGPGDDTASPGDDTASPGDDTGAGGDGTAADTTPDTATPTPGFNYECEPGTWRACVTACGSAGQQLCLKAWGPCVPPGEFCANCADDDCDGLVNEGCPLNEACQPPVEPTCPVAVISLSPGPEVGVGETVTLSGAQSAGAVAWQWAVQAPAGSAATLQPSAAVASPTFTPDVAGTYLFSLDIWTAEDVKSCVPAQAAVTGVPFPPVTPEVGCADGQREGFLDEATYSQIAGCAGAWDQPGITPAGVQPTCGLAGGDDGAKADGAGCSAPDLCAAGWHVCEGWQEVAARSPTGCAGAVPPGAKSKSLFFAIRQPSENGSVCGAPGAGFNDVFGCGNLGAGLGPDKQCGPLDRVLASTQPNTCGFNEAEPPLGPWQCSGGPGSDLLEGQNVTKKGCPGQSCSYDGVPLGNADKGGVLCCRD